MGPANEYDDYQKDAVESRTASASPQELVVMLCDGFLDELDRLTGHIEHKDFARKSDSIKKCIDIIAALDISLDLRNGGEVAQRIHELYEHIRLQLFDISIKNDASGIDNVRAVITDLKEGWEGLGTQPDSA